ncbi:CRM-domain containing factor CFM9, mitochondrial [Aristolochia californica]|uniref:CRM-domain containing factor CFM9, mitochondrial n=1 Tax=Aristolochia californica TaxID=171875 RepID=UPI0035D59731
MANRLFSHTLRRHSLAFLRLRFPASPPVLLPSRSFSPPVFDANSLNHHQRSWEFKCFSHGIVNLVLSQGKPKFETHEIEPPKKEKWKTKKQFKLKMKKEKKKRKEANKRDPRCLTVKGKKKKQKFQSAEERIKYKIEKAKIKEALLLEKLKRYEIPPVQGPEVEPENLTGEERFFIKKMAQKRSNYAPIGRRGIYAGCIQNMHLHWKKHETVEVIFNKSSKLGQIDEYEKEIARLSGGTPIERKKDAIIFYRGKNYVQPREMLPVGTLSKKKALEKSKYEQSLESVHRFIALSEKELELYYRHIALYGDPNTRTSDSAKQNKGLVHPQKLETHDEIDDSARPNFSTDGSGMETGSEDYDFKSKSGDVSDTEGEWETN